VGVDTNMDMDVDKDVDVDVTRTWMLTWSRGCYPGLGRRRGLGQGRGRGRSCIELFKCRNARPFSIRAVWSGIKEKK
jgi:hypothetical protein